MRKVCSWFFGKGSKEVKKDIELYIHVVLVNDNLIFEVCCSRQVFLNLISSFTFICICCSCLHNNNFYGAIPSEMENCTELQRMYVSYLVLFPHKQIRPCVFCNLLAAGAIFEVY